MLSGIRKEIRIQELIFFSYNDNVQSFDIIYTTFTEDLNQMHMFIVRCRFFKLYWFAK